MIDTVAIFYELAINVEDLDIIATIIRFWGIKSLKIYPLASYTVEAELMCSTSSLSYYIPITSGIIV